MNRLNNVLLIDGSYMLHRVLHIKEIYDLKTSNGIRSGGFYQFLRSMSYELKRHSEYYPIVCWDGGLSPRRLKLYPNYKNSEDKKMIYADPTIPVDEYLEVYREQRKIIISMLKYLGIPSIGFREWEGDDLISVISRISNNVVIVTDDKDLLQLISPTVTVCRTLANQIIDYEEFQKQYINNEIFISRKSLVGDKSDNIPKVCGGLGEVNAERIAKIIYENPENYLEILSNSDKKVDKDFVKNHQQYLTNLELIDLNKIEITDDIIFSVISGISNVMNKIDYMNALLLLNQYEISSIDLDSLILTLSMNKLNINFDNSLAV